MSYPPNPDQPYGQQPPYGYGYQPPTMPPPAPPKRSNVGLIVLLAVGLPLLLIGGCSAVFLVLGSSSSPDTVVTEADSGRPSFSQAPTDQQQASPKKETPTARVGETISLAGLKELKVAVTLIKVAVPATPAQDFLTPKPGHHYVAVQLTLANEGQTVYSDSPTNGAHLIDAEGQQYSSSFGEVKEGKAFGGSVTMSGGDTRKGVIVFEVPESAKLAKFQFALDSGFADQKGEWVLS